MSKSNYERNRNIDMRYGDNSPAYTRPGTVYLALFTVMPTPSTPGTEVSGGSYARQGVTNDSTNFPDATAGAKSLGAPVTFPAASAPWGSVVGFAWMDAVSAGNMLDFAPLTTPRTVTTGDVFSFATGQITWSES